MKGCALEKLGGCSTVGWLQWHHPLPKAALKSKFKHGGVKIDGKLVPLIRTALVNPEVTLDELLGDTRNRVWACAQHHAQIEWKRVYVEPPESAWDFAREVGLDHLLLKAQERRAA